MPMNMAMASTSQRQAKQHVTPFTWNMWVIPGMITIVIINIILTFNISPILCDGIPNLPDDDKDEYHYDNHDDIDLQRR